MKITKEKLANSRLKLIIEVEPKELVKYFRLSYEKIAKNIKIDGFRAGSAPYKLVETAAGYNRLYTEGVDMALQLSYPKALEEEKIIPISQPQVNLKKSPQYSLDSDQIKDSLIYEILVDIMPNIILEDYKKLKIKEPKKRQAKKEDVEKIFNHLRRQKATFLEIKQRGIKKGDRAEINFEGYLKKVRIDKMCSKNFPLIIGEGNLIPGFEDKLIGMKKGEKREFKIVFPKNYYDKEIASKEAEFKVELIDCREVVLPELNDDFAKNFGQKNISDLNKAIKKNLEIEIEAEHRNIVENLVIEKVLPKLKTEMPESLVSEELARMIENFKKQIETQGLNFEKYLMNIKKNIEDLKKDMRPQAEKNIKIGFILGKIIEEKKYDKHQKDAGKKALDYLVKTLVHK